MSFIFRIIRGIYALIAAIFGIIQKIYSKIPPKLLSLLILLSTLPFIGYGIYWTFFLNIGAVEFRNFEETTGLPNTQEVTVEIRKKTIAIQAKNCKGSCKFEKLPAGEYVYVAKMLDRVAITGTVKIMRNSNETENLLWRYDVGLIDIQKKSEATTDPKTEEITGTQEKIAETFEDGRTNPFEVRTDPLRLSVKNQTGSLFESKTAINYNADSLNAGIFLALENNGEWIAFDTSNNRTHTFRWNTSETGESPVRIKKLNGTQYWAVLTTSNLYLYDVYGEKMEELSLYDDIEMTKSGKMIALIKAGSSEKRSILNISDEVGDILFDISEAGSPKILKRGLTGVKNLFYFEKGVFTNQTDTISDTIGITLDDGKQQIISPYQ